MLANYHTHTYRCKHASGEDREYVEAAIKNGFKVLGFADHCPWVFPYEYISHIRMLPNQLDDYFNSLTSLREEYKKDITLYIGFESEYIEGLVEEQEKIFKGYPIDYMIIGQHYNKREELDPYNGTGTTNENTLEEYVRLVIKGLETNRYKYVAHPDTMNFIGSPDIYEKHMKHLCTYLKSKNIPIEINMLGFLEKRHYPSDRFLKIAKEVGNTAIVGVDAHAPKQLLNKEGQLGCKEYAKSYGLKVVDYLEGLGPKL